MENVIVSGMEYIVAYQGGGVSSKPVTRTLTRHYHKTLLSVKNADYPILRT